MVTDGFVNEGEQRQLIISRGRNAPQRIVVRAPAGVVTIGAIDWCNRMGIPIAFVGSDSRLMNCLIPDNSHDGPVKRAQAVSGINGDGLRLVRWLLERKFESQIRALEVDLARLSVLQDRLYLTGAAVRDIKGCIARLTDDRTLEEFLSREGLAAQRYWQVLAGTILPWPEWAKKRIPEHWTQVWPRNTGKRFPVRDATDPFNAMLNYGYTLLEVEARVACATHGLDPDLGLLHVDDRLRESFIYDLLEPIRATVDHLCLEFACQRGIRPHMFHELRDGVVRLDPDLARDLAHYLMPRLRRPTLEFAAAYTTQLRRVKVPYVLERLSRQFSPAGKVYERTRSRVQRNCEYCKQPLPRRGLKFCGRDCYLRHSVEIRQPIKLAQQKLAELRAQGVNPGHGGEAAKKRGAAMALTNRRRSQSYAR